VIPFNYNDTETFLNLMDEHKNCVAAVVMEPIRNHIPKNGFLETIRQETQKAGVILVFDEITSGWRLNLGGAHLKFAIEPDVAVFAKAISNGFPMAAIIGKQEVMDVVQDTFISSTYWTERVGPVAALATIQKLKAKKVWEHLAEIGEQIQIGWKEISERHDLPINVSGIYPLGHFSFDHEKPLVLKTLLTQLMLEKGFLATTAFYASYAHKKEHIKEYLGAVDETFAFISNAVKNGSVENYLKGPVCHSGFARLT
jgi:glutamate-1-semialdehyde aminotransferase